MLGCESKLVHIVSNFLGMPRGAKSSLASMNQIRLLFIQIQTLPPRCTISGKKILILQNNEWKIIRDKLPAESAIDLKGSSIV